ncbi:MAG: hypothetical protein SFV55_19455 [Haliscomenobacter sp.]|uniref:hypothetical protein n=1 Tax=Haliscomenobacter sp. TaxID=2717303 RepID=UPI0029A1E65F|nr:hypothetical protein [Haliscomenobacter sp.]MDX2070614.1 hypothetical protein [Haliscomenobacter sp.]
MHNYVLKFEDKQRPFKDGHGIPLGRMVELLAVLVKAVGATDAKDLVLKDVLHESYGLNLATPDATIHHNLKVIHANISQNELKGFSDAQMNYARKLKAIIGDQLSLEAYDPQDNERYSVTQFDLPTLPKYYFELGDVYGILTSIGSPNLTEKAKSVIRIAGFAHNVEVTAEQEMELLPYFKKAKLVFSIRKRIDMATKEIKGAMLEDFKLSNPRSFAEMAEELKAAQPDGLFNEIENTAEYFHKLRASNE